MINQALTNANMSHLFFIEILKISQGLIKFCNLETGTRPCCIVISLQNKNILYKFEVFQ
jgi:hypothetical protein